MAPGYDQAIMDPMATDLLADPLAGSQAQRPLFPPEGLEIPGDFGSP